MYDVMQQLRRLLKANGAFSMSSALVMAAFADFWASYLIIWPTWVLYGLAMTVFLFGMAVWWLASRWSLCMIYAKIICALDFAWVGGSIILLLGWGATMTLAAVIAITVIAVIVLAFGLRQAKLISQQQTIDGAFTHASQ